LNNLLLGASTEVGTLTLPAAAFIVPASNSKRTLKATDLNTDFNDEAPLVLQVNAQRSGGAEVLHAGVLLLYRFLAEPVALASQQSKLSTSQL
jgi:hypothetical protein